MFCLLAVSIQTIIRCNWLQKSKVSLPGMRLQWGLLAASAATQTTQRTDIQNTSDCCCCCGCGAVISAARPTLPDLTLRIPALNLEFPAVDPFRFPGGQSLALNIALVHAVLLCMLHFVHSILWTSAAWGARGVGTSVVVTNCSLQSIMCTSAMFTAPQL